MQRGEVAGGAGCASSPLPTSPLPFPLLPPPSARFQPLHGPGQAMRVQMPPFCPGSRCWHVRGGSGRPPCGADPSDAHPATSSGNVFPWHKPARASETGGKSCRRAFHFGSRAKHRRNACGTVQRCRLCRCSRQKQIPRRPGQRVPGSPGCQAERNGRPWEYTDRLMAAVDAAQLDFASLFLKESASLPCSEVWRSHSSPWEPRWKSTRGKHPKRHLKPSLPLLGSPDMRLPAEAVPPSAQTPAARARSASGEQDAG